LTDTLDGLKWHSEFNQWRIFLTKIFEDGKLAFYQVSKLGIWEVFHVRYNIEQILISSDVRIEILEIKVAFTRNPKKRLMDQTRESGSKRTLVFHTSANGGLTSMRSHTHPSTTVLNKEHGTWETFDGLKTNIAH